MSRRWALLAALALLPGRAGAGDFSGYAEAKGFAYAERANEADPWVAAWGTLLLKEEQRLGAAQWTGAVRAEAVSSGEEGPGRVDPADRELRRSPVSLRELWVRLSLATSLDLQVGRFALGWGKTDGYSPADAFLPRDLSDPFADEKLPLWAARLSGQRGPVRFEGVAVPVTTPWRLPVLGSRNAPVAADSTAGPIEVEEDDDPPPVPGFGALRLLATLGDWDLGAWARFGVRPAPLLEFGVARAVPGSSGLAVPVKRRYAREEAVGVELSRVVGPWVIRAEAAGLRSRDPDLGNALIGTASAERGFGDGTLLVTLAANGVDPPGNEALLFDRALLPALITAWNRTEAWGSWKAVWTVGLAHGDGLVKAEGAYDLTDRWKATLGAEVPYGSEAGALGALRAARRAHIALRRSW